MSPCLAESEAAPHQLPAFAHRSPGTGAIWSAGTPCQGHTPVPGLCLPDLETEACARHGSAPAAAAPALPTPPSSASPAGTSAAGPGSVPPSPQICQEAEAEALIHSSLNQTSEIPPPSRSFPAVLICTKLHPRRHTAHSHR